MRAFLFFFSFLLSSRTKASIKIELKRGLSVLVDSLDDQKEKKKKKNENSFARVQLYLSRIPETTISLRSVLA